MPILMAWFISGVFGRILLSRAVMLMAVWVLVPLTAAWIAMARMPEAMIPVCSVGTLLAMLAFALHRPTSSTRKLAMLDGLFIWCRVLILFVVIREVARLILGKAPLSVMISSEMGWMLIGLIAFCISKALEWWVRRDWQRAERLI